MIIISSYFFFFFFTFSKEFREGGRILMQKLQKYKPRIAAFNGKCENLNLE